MVISKNPSITRSHAISRLADKYYPQLQPLSADNYSAPLQLLAKELKFIDPITQQQRCFRYDGNLSLERS